jgi:hypothetical protein
MGVIKNCRNCGELLDTPSKKGFCCLWCEKDHAEKKRHFGGHLSGADRLHCYWSLSYASYLTVPRVLMQSMPDEWQNKMAALLEELDTTCDRAGVKWPEDDDLTIDVRLLRIITNGLGDALRKTEVYDRFSIYERGRKRIDLTPKNEKGKATKRTGAKAKDGKLRSKAKEKKSS